MRYLPFITMCLVTSSPLSAQVDQKVRISAAELARQIAEATFQSDKAYRDALANWDRQFNASAQRSAAGRKMTPLQAAKFARLKSVARAEMARQIKADVIPSYFKVAEAEYLNNYTQTELQEAAAFWTSPAGLAFTAEAHAAGLRGQSVSLPPAFAGAVSTYLTSAVGLKEGSRRAVAQKQFAQVMMTAMQRAMSKVDAVLAAEMARP